MLMYTDNCKGVMNAPIVFLDTTIVLGAGEGAFWPVLGVGDWTYTTIIDAGDPTNLEIVRVTARVADTLTVVRGVGGTQQGWAAGSRMELRVCKAMLDDLSILPTGLMNPTLVIVAAGYTAAAGDLVYVDTSGGSFSITFPPGPANGDRIGIIDVVIGGSFQGNPLIINQNGELIDGVNDTFRLDVDKLYLEFVYDATGGNWIVAENPLGGTGGAASGGTGVTGTPSRVGAVEVDGAVNLVDTNLSLYVVPAATYPAAVVVKITNRNNAVVVVRLAHVDGGIGTIVDEDHILYDSELQPYETRYVDLDGAVIADTLVARSDTVDVNFMATALLATDDLGFQRIAATAVLVDTDTTLATAAGVEYEFCSIIAVNKSATVSATIRTALIDGAVGALADEDYMTYEDVLLQSETKMFSETFHFPDTYTVMVRASDANVHFLMYGRERV